MCIIAYAPAGASIPEQKVRNMFSNNPHGAGIMWKPSYREKVQIRKGFMTVDELIKTWNSIPVKCEKAIHCRIATAGKVGPACCHPFPIRKSVDRMRKTKDQETMVLMHNGIISYCNPPAGKEGETSDTMNFAAEVVYPLRFMLDKPKIQQTLEQASNSKLLIFRSGAKTIRLGQWVECDGVFYSNGTYTYEKSSGWGKYGYDSCRGGYYSGYSYLDVNKHKSHKKQKMTNIWENEVYETEMPIETEALPKVQKTIDIPVWTTILSLDDEPHKKEDRFFEEALAYVESSAEDQGLWLYNRPMVIKYGANPAVRVDIIGKKAFDAENEKQLFGLEILNANIKYWISEDELKYNFGLCVEDLELTENDTTIERETVKPKGKPTLLAESVQKVLNKIELSKDQLKSIAV